MEMSNILLRRSRTPVDYETRQMDRPIPLGREAIILVLVLVFDIILGLEIRWNGSLLPHLPP
jgi:hypothetical protein